MSTRRTRTQRARTTCQHCGVTGHSSTICPRNTYSPDLPAATCPACIRTVSILADGTLFMAIQPCNLHTTPTAPPPTQPLPTQLLPTQLLPTQPLPTQPLPTQPLPAQPPAHQAPLPAIQPPLLPATFPTTSSRRTRSYDTLRMQEEYSLVVQLTKAGHTVVKAVDAAGTTMRTFRKTRYIVEMKYAHLSTFLNLESVYTTKNSLAVECQKELKKSVHHEKRMKNFLNGLYLKPFKM